MLTQTTEYKKREIPWKNDINTILPMHFETTFSVKSIAESRDFFPSRDTETEYISQNMWNYCSKSSDIQTVCPPVKSESLIGNDRSVAIFPRNREYLWVFNDGRCRWHSE